VWCGVVWCGVVWCVWCVCVCVCGGRALGSRLLYTQCAKENITCFDGRDGEIRVLLVNELDVPCYVVQA
jgi:hypothetical protein